MRKMHQYAWECIKMYAEWIVQMFCAWKYQRIYFSLHLNRLVTLCDGIQYTSSLQKCCLIYENGLWTFKHVVYRLPSLYVNGKLVMTFCKVRPCSSSLSQGWNLKSNGHVLNRNVSIAFSGIFYAPKEHP